MAALKNRVFALGLCMFAVACGSDEDGGKKTSPVDPPVDASKPDATAPTVDSGAADTGTPAVSACNSFKLPSGNLCGGGHCLDTLDQLKAGRVGGACTSDTEAAGLCDLSSANEVRTCAKSFIGDNPKRDACAAEKLSGKVSTACLKCYLDSAECAAQKCLSTCAVASNEQNTGPCDACRTANKCYEAFYTCSGFKDPDTK